MEFVNETGEPNQKIEDLVKTELRRLNGVACRADGQGKRQLVLVPTGGSLPSLDLQAWTQQGYELRNRTSQLPVKSASFIEGITLDVALYKRQSQK